MKQKTAMRARTPGMFPKKRAFMFWAGVTTAMSKAEMEVGEGEALRTVSGKGGETGEAM